MAGSLFFIHLSQQLKCASSLVVHDDWTFEYIYEYRDYNTINSFHKLDTVSVPPLDERCRVPETPGCWSSPVKDRVR